MTDPSRIELLRRRIQADPASIAFAQLAEEYRRAGDYQASIDVCRAGLDLHPGYISAQVTLARALAQSGREREAGAEFRQALAGAPDNLAARRGLAELCSQQHEWVDALHHYRAALLLAPGDPELERKIGEIMQRCAADADVALRGRSARLMAALEGWLSAVHVTRTQRRA